MQLLDIKQVRWMNFRSYGPYWTTLVVDGLGPALIVGTNEDDPRKSNGVGKTTIVDVILWVLFGRVPTRNKPGDIIVNYDAGQDCIGELTTCNGYIITRTRKVDGHDDLLIHNPNGDDVSSSTNQNAQQYLNKLFDLDYDIFTSSIFFGQFGKPFLELPDLKRKKALERMLHLIKFDVYADVAKEKLQAVETEQMKHKLELEQVDREIIRVSQEIERNTDELNTYENNRKERINTARSELGGVESKFTVKASEIQNKLSKAQTELEAIYTYDITQLQKKWDDFVQRESKISTIHNTILLIDTQISTNKQEKTTLETQKAESGSALRITDLTEQLASAKNELSEIKLHDVEKLAKEWSTYETILQHIDEADSDITGLNNNITKFNTEKKLREQEITKWKGKSGKVCKECRQEVAEHHVHDLTANDETRVTEIDKQITEWQLEIDRISSLKAKLLERAIQPDATETEAVTIKAGYDGKLNEIKTINDCIEQYKLEEEQVKAEEGKRLARIKQISAFIAQKQVERKKREDEVNAARESLENYRPVVTVSEAQLIQKQYEGKGLEIKALQSAMANLNEQKEQAKEDIREKIRGIDREVNPYRKIIDQMSNSLNATKESRATAAKKVRQYDQLIKHIDYIRSAYSDRRKIKAHTLSRMVPYLNERIAYYLNAFECEFTLQLNAFLQIKSNKWPYDQCSGGQRRCIDMAVMFAIYDLHTSIYEQRCNLIVLDEVDGRLDEANIDHFVNLLFKEFASQSKTILVISHRKEMRDAFPTKINVRMSNKLSYIDEVR